MVVLPTMPENYIKRLKSIFNDFIWNGNQLKIKLSTLMGLKKDLGCGLVDLHTRDLTLKANWVLKIKSNLIIRNLANVMINNPLGDLLWEAQLVKEDIKKVIPKIDPFWQSVLEAWFDTTFNDPIDLEQVMEQIVWLNSNICIGSKPY